MFSISRKKINLRKQILTQKKEMANESCKPSLFLIVETSRTKLIATMPRAKQKGHQQAHRRKAYDLLYPALAALPTSAL